MIFHHGHSGSSSRTVFGRAPVILHQPSAEAPALSPSTRDELWWLGKGIYSRQSDGLWKHHSMRFSGKWQETLYFGSEADAAPCVLKIIDVQWELDKAIRAIGLEPFQQYRSIEKAQCEALEQIAERWHLSYCWSERAFKRHFRKPLISYSFTWRYGAKS